MIEPLVFMGSFRLVTLALRIARLMLEFAVTISV